MRRKPKDCKRWERAIRFPAIPPCQNHTFTLCLRRFMHYVADLHVHSKYSRAVSPNMTLPVMEKFARQKGIDILTASDWTHPIWFKEIQNQLEEAGQGVYALKSEYQNPKLETNSKNQNSNSQKNVLFLLSTEISSIYKEAGKLRRIHNLVFAPSIEVAEKINKELIKRGCNLSADGRPIVGLSSRNLLELILSIDEGCFLIPAHVWTPHFGIYGSASGYDSLEEAFGDMSKYIYGIETGLSSDPDMNWSIEELKNRSILSFSDAHSAPKLAREATVFDLSEPSYENIRQAIMRKGKNRIVYTIEFYPEEGKYHFSGHRNCKVVYGPEEIREKGIVCPVCNRRLTEGVLLRVQQLASDKLLKRAVNKENGKGLRWYTDNMHLQPPFVKLVPLVEIIAEGLGVTQSSQKVPEMYEKMTKELDSEINILLKTDIKEIETISTPKIARGVDKVREGQIIVDPGYDGVFGKVKIWNGEEESEKPETPQLSLDLN